MRLFQNRIYLLFHLSLAFVLLGCGKGFQSISNIDLDSSESTASQLLNTIRSTAAHLAVTSAVQKVPIGSCSAVVTIRLASSGGNTVTFSGEVGLSMPASSKSLAFYSDSACSVAFRQYSFIREKRNLFLVFREFAAVGVRG